LLCSLFVLCLISFVPKALGIVLAYGIWHATISQAGTLVCHCLRLGLLVCHSVKHKTLVCHWLRHDTLVYHGLASDTLVCQSLACQPLASCMPQSQIWHGKSWLPLPNHPMHAIYKGRPGLGSSPPKFKPAQIPKFKRAKIYNFYPQALSFQNPHTPPTSPEKKFRVFIGVPPLRQGYVMGPLLPPLGITIAI
jgi:hypothetical protein